MRVIFAAYRDWAKRVLPAIERHPRVELVKHVETLGALELEVTGQWQNTVMWSENSHETAIVPLSLNNNVQIVGTMASPSYKSIYDVVLLCGWSWQVSERLLSKIPVISEHPASHDRYSLGTPLQNQIADGVKYTKHRIVKIGYPELSDRLYSPKHEVDMNLTGNMDDILSEMESTARTIYTHFLDDYPNINWKQWDKTEHYAKPRTPVDSQMSRTDFVSMLLIHIYDKIRMLEAPYPNAYIEDASGTLYFEKVRFKAK
jgi:methionyl-tRNA formyltransferase